MYLGDAPVPPRCAEVVAAAMVAVVGGAGDGVALVAGVRPVAAVLHTGDESQIKNFEIIFQFNIKIFRIIIWL